jgi:ankyrin repeat protein
MFEKGFILFLVPMASLVPFLLAPDNQPFRLPIHPFQSAVTAQDARNPDEKGGSGTAVGAVQPSVPQTNPPLVPEQLALRTLHDFAGAGIVQKVKELLDSGTDINARNEKGRTPFYVAILENQVDVVNLLISRGADVRAADQNGWQPVHAAAFVGSANILQLLKAKGADLNAVSSSGTMPIHIAAESGQNTALLYLLSSGAQIDAFDGAGNTPCHLAVNNRRMQTVELLLGKGADVRYANHQSRTLLTLAVQNNDPNMVQLLLNKGVPIDQYDGNGSTALDHAVGWKSAEIVKILLERGANPNVMDATGFYPIDRLAFPQGGYSNKEIADLLFRYGAVPSPTQDTPLPVFLSAEFKDKFDLSKSSWSPRQAQDSALSCLEKYLKAGGDIRARDPHGNTFLHWAAFYGFADLVRVLIDAGVEVNALNAIHQTPLLVAERGFPRGDPVVQILLDAGADANAADFSGRSVLQKMVSGEDQSRVRSLLEHGADVNAQNAFGETALYCLCRSGDLPIARLLVDKGADVNLSDFRGQTPLFEACRTEKVQIVQYLLEHGAKADQPDFYETCPIHISTHSEPVMDLLLKHGADINRVNYLGCTALSVAASAGRENMVRFLIEHKADVNRFAKNGATPLQEAAFTGKASIVKLLLDSGADPAVKNSRGKTALDFAREKKNIEVIALLDKNAAPKPLPALSQEETLRLRKAKRAQRKDPQYFRADLWAQADSSDLHKAILREDLPAVEKAIAAGAKLNELFAFENHRLAPLHCAVYVDDEAIIKLLLDKGADINVGDAALRTPLHWAADLGLTEVAELLIQAGANINALDSGGTSPFSCAVISKEPDLIKLFLAHGVDINQIDGPMKQTALHSACGNNGPYELLITLHADVNARDSIGRTPLHFAMRDHSHPEENVKVGKYLLDHGADVEAVTKDGDTPLHYACDAPLPYAVKMLVEQGANVHAVNKSGYTPLFLGCRDPEIAKLLLEHGANPNARDKRQATPLHNLAGFTVSPQSKSIELLLEAGADINAQTMYSETSVFSAAQMGNVEYVRLLVDHHADLRIPDKDGRTLLHVSAGREDLVRLFLQQGLHADDRDASGRNAIHAYANKSMNPPQEKALDLLIADGGNINAQDRDGFTPLCVAAMYNMTMNNVAMNDAAKSTNARIVQQLLNRGADWKIKSARGDSPLSSARRANNAEIIALLESVGATE